MNFVYGRNKCTIVCEKEMHEIPGDCSKMRGHKRKPHLQVVFLQAMDEINR